MKKQTHVKGSVDDHKKSKGWFLGRFMDQYGYPELNHEDIEVCWKKLEKGFKDPLHYHKEGTEIAIMINGWFSGNVDGKEFRLDEREYLVVYPETNLEVTDYKVGTEFVLIKFPSVPNDKYFVNEN